MSDTENLELEELGDAAEEPKEPTGESANGTDDAPEAAGETPALAEEAEGVDVMRSATDLEAVYDVPVQVSAVLGKAHMQVSQLLKLGRGAVVELDRKVGEAIDIYVNDRLVARGEVVVVEDRLGVTMTEIVKQDRS